MNHDLYYLLGDTPYEIGTKTNRLLNFFGYGRLVLP